MSLKSTFLALIAVQALHSLEEYSFRLYDVFPPARFVSGLFSRDLEVGFVVFNCGLLAFGGWCCLWPVRREWSAAVALAWLWVGIELVNGMGRPTRSILRRGYTPGAGRLPAPARVVVNIAYVGLSFLAAEAVRNRLLGPPG